MKTQLIAILLIAYLPYGFTQGENLFDDSFLHEIRFDNMDTTLIDGTKVYQMVNVMIDGVSLDSIGIKEKGNISNNVPNLKVPFKIKTNKYVPGKKYDGIKEFTLHNNYMDPTMLREKITYDICAQLDLLALRTAFAKVYIEGEYWGLYTIVEGKDEMFKQRFNHRDADAVESLDIGNMCYISNNPDDYNVDANGGLPYYQLENGNAQTAFQRFATMLDVANNTSDATYLDIVSDYFNLEDFFKYQAINVYLMNMDSYIAFGGNQIYMYDTAQQVFQTIPWDFNASLSLWNNNNFSPTSYEVIPDAIANGCIASRLNTIPELKEEYLNTMCQLKESICAPNAINTIIDSWKDQIKEAVYDDYRKTFSNQDFDKFIETGYFENDGENVPALKTFFAERFSTISSDLSDLNYTCAITTSINELPQGLVKVYPNPASEIIHINTEEKIEKIALYDLLGHQLKATQQAQNGISVKELSAGIYVLKLEFKNQTWTQKIVIR